MSTVASVSIVMGSAKLRFKVILYKIKEVAFVVTVPYVRNMLSALSSQEVLCTLKD